MRFFVTLNFTLVSTILFGYLNPNKPNIIHYEKNLENIDFPLSVKLCFKHKDEIATFQRFGYKNVFTFYAGKSRFDEEVYGWNGHSADNGTLFNSSIGSCRYPIQWQWSLISYLCLQF